MYLQCYSQIQIVALERMYTVYPRLYTSQLVNYTTVLEYMKAHSYPKSIISSGSSTGAQKPRKLSIPAPIAANFIQGDLPGKVLQPVSIS